MKSLALAIFSLGTMLSGILVITSLKPINAILALILAFLNGVGLFILLGEDFIGLIYIIIYIGAIVILFLFVIMLLNIQRESFLLSLAFFKATKPMALLIGSLYLLVFSNTLFSLPGLGYGVYNGVSETFKPFFASIESTNSLSNIGEILYNEWGYEMLLILSLILLVGMIGAIVLTYAPSLKSDRI